MPGRAPLWGLLAVPVGYRSEFPALLLFGFPHPSAKKAHGGTKIKSKNQEAYVQCLCQPACGQAAFTPPTPAFTRENSTA